MKRKLLLLTASMLLSVGFVKAQFAPYNKSVNIKLDTTAVYNYSTTQSVTSFLESKPGVSATQFFPYPTTYTARALFAAGATADAQFAAASNVLTMKNPTTTLIKSSFYNIQNASAIASFAFDLDLTNYTGAAPFAIYFGNDNTPSRLISASSGYANASTDIFGSFRIVLSGGTLVTQYRDAAGSSSVAIPAANSLIKAGVSQRVEIFANSTASATSYTYNASAVTLAANTYHVYVGGVKYSVDFPKNGSSYSQTVLDGLTFEFANNATLETIAISNVSVTYPSSVDPTLPVSLTSFTGKVLSNGVELNWITASEQNNDYFELLRASDGKNYTSLGKITGKGNSNEMSKYAFTDRNPNVGYNYYQLKQVDKDGTAHQIEETVALKYSLNQQDDFKVFSKGNVLSVAINAANASVADFYVYDTNGKKLTQTKLQLNTGNHTYSVDASNLPKGILVARLSSNDGVQTVKFLR